MCYTCVQLSNKNTWFPRNEVELFIHKFMLFGGNILSLSLSHSFLRAFFLLLSFFPLTTG